MAISGPESIVKLRLINQLRKAKRPVWARVREILMKSSRREAQVNLYRLDKFTKANDTVVVAGKLLAVGKLTHPLTVAYVSASKQALDGLKESKSKSMPLQEFLEKHADAKNIKIVI